MYGDFSRNSFRPHHDYLRVLMQQGRPLTDADWNEQVAILIELERELICNHLSKTHADFNLGFNKKFVQPPPPTTSPAVTPPAVTPPAVTPSVATPSVATPAVATPAAAATANSLYLTHGTCFVDGLPCKLKVDWPTSDGGREDLLAQLRKRFPSAQDPEIYLEAWEQSVNPLMHGDMLEPTLNNNDTAWRSRVVWRIIARTLNVSTKTYSQMPWTRRRNELAGDKQLLISRGQNKASTFDPCESNKANMTELDEVLYRVEVHKRGMPFQPSDPASVPLAEAMTFKWSRDNGSTIYPIETPASADTNLKVSPFRFASKTSLEPHDRLELRDQHGRSVDSEGRLIEVSVATPDQICVSKGFSPKSNANNYSGEILCDIDEAHSDLTKLHYHVQRWNQSGYVLADTNTTEGNIKTITSQSDDHKLTLDPLGACIAVVGTSNSPVWLELERGIRIQFRPNTYFEEGDYWLLRTTRQNDSGFIGVHSAPHDGSGSTSSSVYALPLTGFRSITALRSADSAPAPPAQGNAQASSSNALADADRDKPNQAAVLSTEGALALKGYFRSSRDLTRHVPARYLNHQPESDAYRRFRAPLLVSDILEPSLQKYLEKVERCLPLTNDTRDAVLKDAEHDYRLAADFKQIVSSGQSRSLFA